jgi:hypothetical protein
MTSKENTTPNDEIDLLELFQKMGNAIKNGFMALVQFIYQIILFLVRKSVFIGIVVILGLIWGGIKYKTSPRYYSSRLEAYSNTLSSIDMINYINNIHELFAQKNIENLESKLGTTEETLKNVKDVQAFKVMDFNDDGITDEIDFNNEYSTADTTVSDTRFVVKVEVFDQEVFPVIQNRIISYIGQNTYINEMNQVRKRQLHELIAQLGSEITMLDSLKREEYFKKEDKMEPQQGQLLVMNEKETQLYHPQLLSLYKEKQELEEQLELRMDPITIIQDFSALSITENNLMTYLKKYGVLALVLSIVIGLLWELRPYIRRMITDAKTNRFIKE